MRIPAASWAPNFAATNCEMVPGHPRIITTKFKVGSTHIVLSLYKVQSCTKPKPNPIQLRLKQKKQSTKFKLQRALEKGSEFSPHFSNPV
jgi:hypothetical protein